MEFVHVEWASELVQSAATVAVVQALSSIIRETKLMNFLDPFMSKEKGHMKEDGPNSTAGSHVLIALISIVDNALSERIRCNKVRI